MALFRGCGVAIATPFNEDGSVDFKAYGNLINWQIEQGIDAIIACGTTGAVSYTHLKSTLDSIVTKHTCSFSLGSTQNDETIYTLGYIKTPLYYLLRFFTQKYESIYVDTYYIILKKESSYHILCWNLNLTHEKELTIKSESISARNFVTISKINIDDYSRYLSDVYKRQAYNLRFACRSR